MHLGFISSLVQLYLLLIFCYFLFDTWYMILAIWCIHSKTCFLLLAICYMLSGINILILAHWYLLSENHISYHFPDTCYLWCVSNISWLAQQCNSYLRLINFDNHPILKIQKWLAHMLKPTLVFALVQRLELGPRWPQI